MSRTAAAGHVLTISAEAIDTFMADVSSLVDTIDDEHEITQQIASLLRALLVSGWDSPR